MFIKKEKITDLASRSVCFLIYSSHMNTQTERLRQIPLQEHAKQNPEQTSEQSLDSIREEFGKAQEESAEADAHVEALARLQKEYEDSSNQRGMVDNGSKLHILRIKALGKRGEYAQLEATIAEREMKVAVSDSERQRAIAAYDRAQGDLVDLEELKEMYKKDFERIQELSAELDEKEMMEIIEGRTSTEEEKMGFEFVDEEEEPPIVFETVREESQTKKPAKKKGLFRGLFR